MPTATLSPTDQSLYHLVNGAAPSTIAEVIALMEASTHLPRRSIQKPTQYRIRLHRLLFHQPMPRPSHHNTLNIVAASFIITSSSVPIDFSPPTGSLGIREPDPSKLAKEQIDRERDMLFDALYLLVSDGNNLVNLSDRFPAFSSPTRQELADIRRSPSPPEDSAAVAVLQQARAAAAQLEKEHQE